MRRVWKLERRHLELVLAGKMKRRPARHEQLQLRRCSQDGAQCRRRVEQVLDVVQHEQGDLGILSLYERRVDDAAPLFARAALESAIRTGWRINVAYWLRGLAATAGARGDLEAAARLLGAAETIEEEIGERVQGYARRIYTKTAAQVLERLDQPQIAAAHAAGRAMSQADAVEYALTNVAEQAPL
jgi:hypothetical protein